MIDDRLSRVFEAISRGWWLFAAAGVAICALGAWLDAASLAACLLTAWLFWAAVSLGALSLVLVHNLTGGAWGRAIRGEAVAAARLIPLVVILAVPLALCLHYLYPWARADSSANSLIRVKQAYLNQTDFAWRELAIGLVFSGMAWTLTGRTNAELATDEPSTAAVALSGVALILYVFLVTFWSVDWVMSLEPEWYSAVFGVLFVVGNGLSALAFCAWVALARRGALWDSARHSASADVNSSGYRSAHHGGPLLDVGNLLLAFTMLWTYIAFSQYLIIWYGNLPEEASWYLKRTGGGWQWVALALVGLHFVVPFLLLLQRLTKLDPRRLSLVAGGLLVMRWIDLLWLTRPSLPATAGVHWLDAGCMAAIGGLWLGGFLWQTGAQRRAGPRTSEAPHG